jgi:hypothetical protein
MHFSQGKEIKTICRELNLSQKVVRTVDRSGATEFSYKRTVQPRPKLGACLAELDQLLAVNAARASRELLTVMQLYEELRGQGRTLSVAIWHIASRPITGGPLLSRIPSAMHMCRTHLGTVTASEANT